METKSKANLQHSGIRIYTVSGEVSAVLGGILMGKGLKETLIEGMF